MKNYRQLIKELPSKTVVMSIGSFNPPTVKHEMAFKLVEKLVHSHNADHVIYVTEENNTLPVDRKIYFLELMFNKLNFTGINEDRLVEEVSKLKNRYKNVVIVTSEDKVKTFEKALTSKLFESVQVVSTGDQNPDNNKIKSYVTKGDYHAFKLQMPSSLRDIDARRMMNEMRQVSGLEVLKEELKFNIDQLREKYFKGEIYHVGDLVESAGQQYEIMDRGANYLVVVDKSGDLHRKWVKDVTLLEEVKKATGGLKKACWKGYTAVGTKKKNGRTVPNCVPESIEETNSPELSYKGYTTSHFHCCADTANAFKLSLAGDINDPVAMLNAIKTTDTYLKINKPNNDQGHDQMVSNKHIKISHIKAKDALVKLGVFHNHSAAWEKHKKQLDELLGEEVIEESRHDNENIKRSAMTYQQFMKLGKVQPGFVKDTRIDKTPIEPNISQQIDDLQDWPFETQTEVGHTLATRRHLRRQKVMYATEGIIAGDMMDEEFVGTFTEGHGGEVGDGIGDEKIVKVKTIPPQLAPKKDPKDVERTKDLGFSAFYEKAKKQAKENVDVTASDLVNYRLKKE